MSRPQKKILIIVPDGIGVRNYLYSSHFQNLTHNAQVNIWTGVPADVLLGNLLIPENNTVPIVGLRLFEQPVFSKFFWETASWARLKFFSRKVKNKSLLFNRAHAKWSLVWRLFLFCTRFLGTLISWNYWLISLCDKLSKRFWSEKTIRYYQQELKKGEYDSILITHQRVAQLMPICLAANKLGVEVTSVIFSWDNIPKAKLAIQADYFLVWSKHMKEELLIYYREIKQENVIITGTPQFEFYFQNDRILSREEFANRYGLDLSRKWICYSGDDITTSPYDERYLEDALEAIAAMEDDFRPQVIFRRAPVDFSDRYDQVREKYKDLVKFIDPVLLSDSSIWNGFLTSPEDVNLLVNMVRHCELVINIGSTMAHDFAVYDKPCIYINYNVDNRKNWSVHTVYKFQHFRSMDGMNPVVFLDDKYKWAETIKYVMSNPDKVAPDRKKWLGKIVLHPLEKSSERIVDQLIK
ncbi:hypothetical protein [Algoriphagus sp. NG3]|uniref:hypothetical protein n=1 Tax=Algoriphagus sp. NG3 TaxID=3097546 RepID=UPI002A83A0F9|nr:hypothetical protein [Algoriphagus sp. NG3]WPR77811.1 hypothetical protein SLW71_10685 [Algoriphagus sp. NG3]